ncbi:hypothetical protein Tco_0796402, partial [Tanacetum coccineum]
MDISQKDKNKAKTDKTEHGNGKSAENQSRRRIHILNSEPEDSLIMGDENLSTIPEKESDEFIKSSVEDLVPIPM